jgi:hypothetical protein
MSQCELPFWKNPAALISDFNLSYQADCDASKWNFSARLLILAIIFGLIGMPVAGSAGFLITIGFAFVVAIIIILTGSCAVQAPQVKFELPATMVVKEQFQNMPSASSGFTIRPEPAGKAGPNARLVRPEVIEYVGLESDLPYNDAAPYSGPALPESVLPTSRNLFMNVLLDEYKYNPTRPAAAPVTDPLVKQTMDDYFRVQWFSDPTDVFGKNQNQRQFVTQPSTSIPNDRESYQNWLYKIPGKTCKESGQNCLAGTDGGPITWLNQQY